MKLTMLWYLTIMGAVGGALGNLFGDMEKLDIDTQLHEIDEILDHLNDDDTDDDVFNFDDIDDMFSGECIYRCRNGVKPVPKVGHVPTTNGCGSFGLQLDTSALPQMTECCDSHDYCYDTCNQDRDKCDDDFKMCLEAMCENLRPTVTKTQYEGCMDAVNLMYGGTIALGCSPYLSSQEKACDCSAGSRSYSDALPRAKELQNEKKRHGKTFESDTESNANLKDHRGHVEGEQKVMKAEINIQAKSEHYTKNTKSTRMASNEL